MGSGSSKSDGAVRSLSQSKYSQPSVLSLVVALQSDFTQTRETVIVAPLVRKADPGLKAQLQHAVLVDKEPLVVLFASLGAVSTRGLGSPVATLPELREVFVKAIDLLFVGF